MSDLIDRQRAIEAICMETCGVSLRNERCMVHCTEVQAVEKLPPAQPERTPMQELLDVTADRDYWKAQCHSYEMTINRLTESARPERIKGHWIKISPANIYECSECGKSVMTNDICAYDFCHGCGADMREVTE